MDRATGASRWSYDTRQDADNPGFHGAALRAFDASLARIHWSRDPSAGRWTSSRAYRWNGRVLAASGRGEVAAVSAADGSLLWSDRLKGVIRGMGTDEETIYLGNQDGTIFAYRPASRLSKPEDDSRRETGEAVLPSRQD